MNKMIDAAHEAVAKKIVADYARENGFSFIDDNAALELQIAASELCSSGNLLDPLSFQPVNAVKEMINFIRDHDFGMYALLMKKKSLAAYYAAKRCAESQYIAMRYINQ